MKTLRELRRRHSVGQAHLQGPSWRCRSPTWWLARRSVLTRSSIRSDGQIYVLLVNKDPESETSSGCGSPPPKEAGRRHRRLARNLLRGDQDARPRPRSARRYVHACRQEAKLEPIRRQGRRGGQHPFGQDLDTVHPGLKSSCPSEMFWPLMRLSPHASIRKSIAQLGRQRGRLRLLSLTSCKAFLRFEACRRERKAADFCFSAKNSERVQKKTSLPHFTIVSGKYFSHSSLGRQTRITLLYGEEKFLPFT